MKEARNKPPSGKFKQLSAGFEHTCGLRVSGKITCWGDNAVEQTAPPGDLFKQVAAGMYHSCGVRPDGAVICWGWPGHTGAAAARALLDRGIAAHWLLPPQDSSFTCPYEGIGLMYLGQGRLEAATRYLNRAVALNPDIEPMKYVHLARVKIKTGDRQAAARLLAKARKLDPKLREIAETARLLSR